MKTLKIYFAFLILLISTSAFSQQKYTLSGTISDKKNGETMIGVTIFPLELSGVGTSCNEYGFYSLTLPEGKYHIVCTIIGYAPDTLFIELTADKKINRTLSDKSNELQEVIVSNKKRDDNIKKNGIGIEKIDIKEIECSLQTSSYLIKKSCPFDATIKPDEEPI